mgnify:CR=1 FL=1|jgi:Cytidylate kinase
MAITVYVISGPAGAGKSTTSKTIAARLPRSAHIEGDVVDRMVVGGYEMPWLSDYHTGLIWRNIESLVRNFVRERHDVVIDYVAFPHNARAIAEALRGQDVAVKYVVLVMKEDELLRRDALRAPDYRMGERCLAGLREIRESRPDDRHVLDTTEMTVEEAVEAILEGTNWIVEGSA